MNSNQDRPTATSTVPPHRTSTIPPQRRRLRNLLLEPRFQLKYTGVIVVVTALVTSILGFLAWRMAAETSQSFEFTLEMHPPADPAVAERMRELVRIDDEIALYVSMGGVALTVLLAVWGLIVTHRVVGPAYKMKQLLRRVSRGHLVFEGQLRKGDQLQELFREFEAMVAALRRAQSEEVAQLDEAIMTAKGAGVPDEALESIVAVRDRMRAALER